MKEKFFNSITVIIFALCLYSIGQSVINFITHRAATETCPSSIRVTNSEHLSDGRYKISLELRRNALKRNSTDTINGYYKYK